MPKKSQTARKSNKKQSKLSSFLSKLNPKTTKAKLVAFILVFGLIGGGYYVYDTYASTHVATMVSTDPSIRRHNSGDRQQSVNTGGKSNRQVSAVWVPQGSTFSHRSPSGNLITPVAQGYYEACFEMFNSRGRNRVLLTVKSSPSRPIATQVINLRQVNGLQTHCARFNPRSSVRLDNMRFDVRAYDANLIVRKVTVIRK